MKTVLFASLMGAALLSPAQAQTTDMAQDGRIGPYIGLGVTTSKHHGIDGTKYSGKLFGGYDFNPTWGIEGGYIGQATFNDTKIFPGPVGSYHFKGRSQSYYMAVKATKQITDKFALISKVGVAHNRSEVDTGDSSRGAYTFKENKTGLYSALGVKYLVTPRVALTLEVERRGRASWAGHKPNTVSINASYGF